MKVKINNLKNKALHLNSDIIDATNVFLDPECQNAVFEVARNELFVAVRIISRDNELLVGEYVNHYVYSNDVPMLFKFTVDWECIKYGFCKLNLWAPELANEFGGCFDKTVKRFYFDWDRYKTCYEEINGIPCKKKNPNI